MAEENLGKHKVPTLRNVDKRPGDGFPKSYMHNGAFKSLEEVVHFYNTRDVEAWPPPEVPENVNTDELGDLGLTMVEEHLIVMFMETLSDGYMMKGPSVEKAAGRNLGLNLVGANPLGPSPVVRFYLSEPGRAQVSLYNVKGQRVATVCDGWWDTGPHEIGLATAGLPSGVYFVQLVGDMESLTEKLVLLK
jgi:hypothetical protein